jgi:uncharacterized protein with FMN-binding domain
MKYLSIALFFGFFSNLAFAQKGQFITVEEYQNKIYSAQLPWQTLWVSKQSREDISTILNRHFSSLRIRYWGEGSRTSWIFSEIGKELPITAAITIDAGRVEDVSILEYRESRGGEVRHAFFTQQFKGVALSSVENKSSNLSPSLNAQIDGITGATLSVRSLKKMVTLALYCHQLTPFVNYQEPISVEEPSP